MGKDLSREKSFREKYVERKSVGCKEMEKLETDRIKRFR